MNKLSKLLLGLSAIALIFASCNDEISSPVIDSLLPATDTTIHVGNELRFSASISSDETFDYRWLVNGEEKGNDALFVFTPSVSGEYAIQLKAENKYGTDSLEANVHVLPRLLISDFEDLPLTGTAFWNGSDGRGKFTNGLLTFENTYNTNFYSWSGFIYTNLNDTITAGYINQYSVFDANNGDNTFAMYWANGAKAIFNNSDTIKVLSLKICNSTYTALSMQNGDAFAKKFGGDTGNEPDFLKLTIKGLNATDQVIGSVDFYLADFRSANSTDDYIIKRWTEVDISSLGAVNKLSLTFESSDNGAWGMNTPAYVCIDDIKYYDPEK